MWAPRDQPPNRVKQPNVAKLWGLGVHVCDFRRKFEEQVTLGLQELQRSAPNVPASWSEVVSVCRNAAFEVLGEARPAPKRPWLEGHWEALQGLDTQVTMAQQQDRLVRQVAQPWDPVHHAQVMQARLMLRRARAERKYQLGVWEAQYWGDLAHQALLAERTRNTGELFRLHTLLGAHQQLRKSDGSRMTYIDVEGEREAWKAHFAAIQSGAGRVQDRVWQNIPRVAAVAHWLAETPTVEEVERCIGQMHNRKAAGEDGFVAEFLKYGGSCLLHTVHEIVVKAWRAASSGEQGEEAVEWPAEWQVGLVVPLWKQKGSKEDKNTWRGVTLLSVGTKVLARLVANRLVRWCDSWLDEAQTGFRPGRGIDDVLQVSRRVAEEVARVDSDEVVLLRFFDIEKAYPGVCRPAMWEVLQRRGCPDGMIRVLQGLHERTAMKVRVHGGVSTAYYPERGLREGCPSSPVLFNIFHDAVMQDYRCRRREAAEARGQMPGLIWEYKVDGKLCKRHVGRLQVGQETGEVLIGDFGYADDTGICGVAEEVVGAEQLFTVVCGDWEERVHPQKTEGLRICGQGRSAMDVPNHGETRAVKHVGGWVSDKGNATAETNQRRAQVTRKMISVSRSWSFRGSTIRGRGGSLKRSVRLTIAKAVIIPTALSTARTRAWNSLMITRLDQVVKQSLFKCWGLRYSDLQEYHISYEMLRRAAGWPSTAHLVMRAALTWLGHVARMPVTRRPKQVLFGWWKGRTLKAHTFVGQARWLERCLARAGIPVGDWFRLAQNRTAWRKRIYDAFPERRLTVAEQHRLDIWTPGHPLPDNSPPPPRLVPLQPDVDGRFVCWVCGLAFEHGNVRQAHYDTVHGVCCPELVTTPSYQCEHCLGWFPTVDTQKYHECPAREPLERLRKVVRGGEVPDVAIGDGRPAAFRHLYTDGSAAHGGGGWAVVIYDAPPSRPVPPDYVLYGPVVTAVWDPNFLGAERGTNNTGELTAIAEACVWLKERGPERDIGGEVLGAEIHYDSEYARDIAVRVAVPKSNLALANRVADLVDEVRRLRPLRFRHVKGHSVDVGNDAADMFADKGAQGRSSPQWSRWSDVPAGWEVIQERDPRLIEACRKCGKRFYDAHSRGGHEGKCRAAGVALPPGRGRCRKCGEEMQIRTVKSHEQKCTGDRAQNRVCRICGIGIEDFRLLRVHEFDCRRLQDRRAAKAAAPVVNLEPQMRPEDAARGQCYKCGMRTLVRNLPGHVNRCRGSELANRTCIKCGQVYATAPLCQGHERRCRV